MRFSIIISIHRIAMVFVLGSLYVSVKSEIECKEYAEKESTSIFQMLLTPRTAKIPREEIKFYLFTRKNQNCYQELNPNTLRHSFLNSSFPTRIIIHGWMNNGFSSINQLIKDAYLTKGDYNVIIVDWGNLATDANYDRATKWVDDVGEVVAEFTGLLHDVLQISYNEIYLIGHSLGAHIAGVAGKLSSEKFNTIYALDPAEPNFENPFNNSRINRASASFVESIHTNMGLLGVNYPVGDASFFPNYGKKQKGCGFLKDCSHSRAYQYFAESINSNLGFFGIECKSMIEISEKTCKDMGNRVKMGGEPSKPKKGYYYVPINWEAPFAKGPNITLDFMKSHRHHRHMRFNTSSERH